MTLKNAITHAKAVTHYNEEAAKQLAKINEGKIIDFCDKTIQAENNCISRAREYRQIAEWLEELAMLKDKYEQYAYHTECIHSEEEQCPATCSQYRDGWNDAMEYIFKNGKGYQPCRKE